MSQNEYVACPCKVLEKSMPQTIDSSSKNNMYIMDFPTAHRLRHKKTTAAQVTTLTLYPPKPVHYENVVGGPIYQSIKSSQGFISTTPLWSEWRLGPSMAINKVHQRLVIFRILDLYVLTIRANRILLT